MKIQNPHDKFFKETFSNIEIAKDFIVNYLPQDIIKIVDLDTLVLQKDSFINEKLKDKVRVRTYPAAQLYTGREEIQAIIKGEIQTAYVISSNMEPVHPCMELKNLPFLFPDIETLYKFFDGPMGQKIFSNVEKKGVSVLGTVSSGSAIISNNIRPLLKVEDFKGLKIRSYGPMGALALKALGAIPVVIASEETYTALQQGVIDGALTPGVVFLARKYYDIQKFVTNAGMMNATLIYLITNTEWWNNLPVDIKAGISEAISRLIKEQRSEIIVDDKKVFEQIKAKGCQVTFLTPAEETEWKKALQPVYTEYGPKIGIDLIKEAQKEIERITKEKR